MGLSFGDGSLEDCNILVLHNRCVGNIHNLKASETCRENFKESKIFTLTFAYVLEAVTFVKGNPDFSTEFHREIIHNRK